MSPLRTRMLEDMQLHGFSLSTQQSYVHSIVKLENGEVTFRYRDNKTQQMRHLRLPAEDFIERFLQHVLPKGIDFLKKPAGPLDCLLAFSAHSTPWPARDRHRSGGQSSST